MKNLTEIICVLDRSGSMESIVNDAIGGFNSFLKSQQATPGEAVMSIVLFDHEYQVLCSGKALADVTPLTDQTFVPRGSTALLDALGKTIDEVGVRLANLPESQRPDKVLFVILTDGQENASQHYSAEQIHQMISHQRSIYSWEFLFLAANQDAFTASERMGISQGNTMNFAADADGVDRVFQNISTASLNFRAMGKVDLKRENLLRDLSDEPEDSDKASGK